MINTRIQAFIKEIDKQLLKKKINMFNIPILIAILYIKIIEQKQFNNKFNK